MDIKLGRLYRITHKKGGKAFHVVPIKWNDRLMGSFKYFIIDKPDRAFNSLDVIRLQIEFNVEQLGFEE